MATNVSGENIYLIVMDMGGMRQVFTEDHTTRDFEDWQRHVIEQLQTHGSHKTTIRAQGIGGHETRHVLVHAGAYSACTVSFMTADDIESAKRKAELAQGGHIVRGR